MSKIKINKVIIWGHKLHSHTHSYIHNAYYMAFKSLGYITEWYDDNTDQTNIDFTNSLFISEHQVDNNIPKRSDCLYILHFFDNDNKYKDVPKENIIELKCSYRDTKRDIINKVISNEIIFNDIQHSFYAKTDHYIFYTLWGTDLLPFEIEKNIINIDNIMKMKSNYFNFVGSPTKLWNQVFMHLKSNNIIVNQVGGVWYGKKALNSSEHMKFIQESIIAPAFQDELQVNDDYVPCRIFKNISYGQMGVTNNMIVQKIFNNMLIYDNNIKKCIYDSLQFETSNNLTFNEKKEIIIKLMNYVKDNHTYKSRIEDMNNFINKFTNFTL